ncbi:MAG: tRNA pseudouridine(55) synthase TruB [Alphaproteobacteria bacterium]|jgi:tRNA pseudouridine55 synthase|tara:strand:- start:788 stop:1741 length:954 start_codon:yes stop_codon:yes gene_type:complete
MILNLNQINIENDKSFSGGWVSIYKPKQITSFSALKIIKKKFLLKKIGFAGTLDPLASGVLPIAFGAATKTIPYLVSSKKKYKFSILWGTKTSSHDLEGEVVDQSDLRPSKNDIIDVIKKFDGDILQRPPKFSAIKVNGKRAYNLARNQEHFTLQKKRVKIHDISLINHKDNISSEFIITCGKGFYIRALARDICHKLGVLGTVNTLERLEVGPFSIENTFSLETIVNLVHSAPAGTVGVNLLTPLSKVLDDIPALQIGDKEAEKFQQGQIIFDYDLSSSSSLGSKVILLNNGRPIGLADICENSFKPKKVFSEEIF